MKRVWTVFLSLFVTLQVLALVAPLEAGAAKVTLVVAAVRTVGGVQTVFPGVTVTVKKAGAATVLTSKVTGSTGRAKFALRKGSYVVECQISGYAFTPSRLAFKLTRNKKVKFSGAILTESAVEAIRLDLVAALAQHAELDLQVPQAPDFYQALADELAQVPGVGAADYAGDTLGTISVKVGGGGILVYRHIVNDLSESETLPAGASHSGLQHPVYNGGWEPPVDAEAQFDVPVTANTYANHFPVASANPDPEYLADDAVTCRQEGKIAIVDFLWTEAHENYNLYETDFLVDGVMIWDRVRRVGEAAGFTVDLFKDTELNLGNYTLLQDYTMVITSGHGGRPGYQTAQRLGVAMTTLWTPELYDASLTTANGISYFEAWRRGQIVYNAETRAIGWTPILFRDGLRPTVPQQWVLGECWAMLPFWVGFYKDADGWHYDSSIDGDVYNFGEGLMDAGVNAVFGYIDPATPRAVVRNLMPYLRRTVGGYSTRDVPPSIFGLKYWPPCMTVQTYFRMPATPNLAIYAPKLRGGSTFTMYAQADPLYLRAACSENRNSHAYMREFMLFVGTPATAFPLCWDTYYSSGVYPSTLVDPLCGQWGERPTTQQAVQDAACQVKISRKATNAFLTP